jgi:EAL domain-containing protein (putative c-di-GMP-specific phosphodiesterase class I)
MSNAAEARKDVLTRIQQATDYPVRRVEDGWVAGHFFNCWLASVFQPILDANANEVTGHAAYIRSATDGTSVLSPWKLFALTEGDTLLVRFDRLCRAIHAVNYFERAPQGNLFVTVQPRLLESVKDDHGRAFESILNIIGVETSRVVIEIPIEVNRDSRLLKHVISNYRSRGYQIAVNHGGASEDWLAELASLYPLHPDIVKLEAPVLLRHSGAGLLVETIHHFGASVLVHEIETPQQISVALEAGADLLQGHAIGAPVRTIHSVAAKIEGLPAQSASERSVRATG